MRPLALEIENLRSYRGRTRIDFSGKGLVAIVGDTGAGKSSLLEALSFALYGQATFGGSARDLVPDDLADPGGGAGARMTVALDFAAGGARWRVVRSMPAQAGGTPPAEHTLEKLDERGGDERGGDERGGETAAFKYFETTTSKRAVDSRIESLVGLDFAAFRSSVLLPQGRFSALLNDTPARRTATLKSLFGLDEIEHIREAERARASRAAARAEEAVRERAATGYSPDDGGPRAIAEAAREEQSREAGRKGRLVEAREELERLHDARQQALANQRKADEEAGGLEQSIEAARGAAADLEKTGQAHDEARERLLAATGEVERLKGERQAALVGSASFVPVDDYK